MSTDSQDDFDRLALDVLNRITKHAEELREFCDSIVIVATLCEGDSSQLVWQKRGNHCAAIESLRRVIRIKMYEERKTDDLENPT